MKKTLRFIGWLDRQGKIDYREITLDVALILAGTMLVVMAVSI